MNPQLHSLVHPVLAQTLGKRETVQVGPVLWVWPEAAKERVQLLAHALPRVKQYYAYKCFNDPAVIRAIDADVAGYDIASEQECRELMALGVDPARMVFANPVKIPMHIISTYQAGVRTYAFQSKSELDKLAVLAPGADVLLRIRVHDTKNETGQKFSEKFGADPADTVDYMQHAETLGLRPMGMTFHVGSQSSNPELWTDAIELCGERIAACERAGIRLSVLDIGGGLPIDYAGEGDEVFQQIVGAVRETLARAIPQAVQIIAEPGRFIAAETACLTTTVVASEVRDGANWLYLDTGVFHGLMETMEFHRLLQRVVPLRAPTIGEQPYVLAGPTCDGDDIIAHNVMLPSGIKIGDTLVITKAGAYTLSYATSFNGIAPPVKRYVGAAVSRTAKLAQAR